MYILFTLITLGATLIGAVFGIGGGIIIKPVMEAISNLPLAHINALSGVTVLCMAAVSFGRYLKNGMKITKNLICLSIGATAGGFLGKYLFDLLRHSMPETNAKVLQYALLIVLMTVVLLKNRLRSFHIQSMIVLLVVGLCMGTLSAFLGIGGGPINLLAIYLVLRLDAKQAAVYSVAVILCSQFTMVCLTTFTGGYAGLDMRPLFVMIPSALAGGLIGPMFHKKWELAQFEKNFNYLMWALIILNIYNITHVLWVG